MSANLSFALAREAGEDQVYGTQQRQRQRQETRKTPEEDGAPCACQEKTADSEIARYDLSF